VDRGYVRLPLVEAALDGGPVALGLREAMLEKPDLRLETRDAPAGQIEGELRFFQADPKSGRLVLRSGRRHHLAHAREYNSRPLNSRPS